MSTEVSTEELRNRFICMICDGIEAASETDGQNSLEETLEAFIFRILAILDQGLISGCSAKTILPAFILAPYVSAADRDYYATHGEDAFADNAEIAEAIKSDISGNLHDTFMEMRMNRKSGRDSV